MAGGILRVAHHLAITLHDAGQIFCKYVNLTIVVHIFNFLCFSWSEAMKLEGMMAQDEALSPSQLRPLTSEMSLLSRPDGSALFNHGDSSVLAAVYGPAEVKMNKEQLDRATVEIVYKPKVGLPGCADRAREKLICDTCQAAILATLHPRTAILVVVQQMQDSGALLSCAINAACLALLDAAVPLRYTVAAVACVIDADGQIIVDPTIKQEMEAVAQMTFTFESNMQGIVTTTCKGSYSSDQYMECLVRCKHTALLIFDFYRDAVKRKVLKAVWS